MGILAPGYQTTRVHQQPRRVMCSAQTCDWYRSGSKGASEGQPYEHPAGVMCGDTTRCKPCSTNGAASPIRCGYCQPCKSGTANCPCPERLPHLLLDEQADVTFYVNRGLGEREVVFDEYDTRTAEGVDAVNHIRTRGL